MEFHGFDNELHATAPAPHTAAPAIAQDLQEPDLAAAAVRDLKLPPFCSADATVWFQRMEIIFRIRQIRSDSSKADHILAALPEDTFPLISGWLADQGDTIQYGKLKQKILDLFVPTPEDRASRLIQLSKLQIGTQRPSAAFMEMKALTRLPESGDGDNEVQRLDLLRVLWLLRMPPAIRAGITNFMKAPEDEILKLADSLQGSTQASENAHVCSAEKHDDHSDGEDVSAVSYGQRRRRKSPAKKRDAPITGKTPNICYYHARFGKDARNCKAPCIFAKND